MNTMPTYRRGRRVYRPGADQNGPCLVICSYVFVILLLLSAPLLFLSTEITRHETYTALSETLSGTIIELSDPNPSSERKAAGPGDVVHGTSSRIESTASDPDMDVTLPGALTLSRRTEYCQWQEIRRKECRTCHRTVRAKDGSTREESYDCDCTTAYDYVKGWRSHRIDSYVFDRPAAHHNPSRDPLPPRTFVSRDAAAVLENGGGVAYIHPEMLEKKVGGATDRPVDWVRAGVPPVPSFWTRWMPDRTRYEDAADLYDAQPKSYAAESHRFTYVGNGYFFSPHRTGSYERLFKGFVQYVEGSLFDWQFGDLVPSCTPGDVRVWYRTQDPPTVSFLGQAAAPSTSTTSTSTPKSITVEPHPSSSSSSSVGFVHSGHLSAPQMIAAEDSASRWTTLLPRLLLLLWSVAVSRLLGATVFGRDVSSAPAPVGIACGGAVWIRCAGFCYVAWGNPPPAATGVPGWRAGWCMLGRWVGAPVDWRVEESYLKDLKGIKEKDYTGESKRKE